MHEHSRIRGPVVSGLFYPRDPGALEREVTALLQDHPGTPGKGQVTAIIAPHAGYMYSGHTAGAAFACIEGQHYESVVILSPSHREYFDGVSVYPGDAYQTPLGTIPIDDRPPSPPSDSLSVCPGNGGWPPTGARHRSPAPVSPAHHRSLFAAPVGLRSSEAFLLHSAGKASGDRDRRNADAFAGQHRSFSLPLCPGGRASGPCLSRGCACRELRPADVRPGTRQHRSMRWRSRRCNSGRRAGSRGWCNDDPRTPDIR